MNTPEPRIVIDIGTHKAQELRLLSGDQYYLLIAYLKWWADWLKRLLKIVIRYKGLTKYGAGAYKSSPARTSPRVHCKYIQQFFRPRNYLRQVRVFAIDPAPHITGKYIDKLQNRVELMYLPIAILPHDDSDPCKITRFYLAHNSLSSSLYAEESSFKQVLCPAFNFGVVIQSLIQCNLIPAKAHVLLRMNCEGSELAIVQSMRNSNLTLANIIGSIGDVGKKHGEMAAREMVATLDKENIKFDYFKGSDPSTWQAGFNLLDQWRLF